MSGIRINKLQTKLQKEKLSAFLVTNPYNIFYLTGFRGISPEERESLLLVDTKGAHLCVPPMYRAEARQVHARVKVRIPPSGTKLFDFMQKQLGTYRGKVGFEAEDLKYAEYQTLKAKSPGLDKRSGAGIKQKAYKSFVSDLRQVKDAEELHHIKKAVRIADQAFKEILRSLRPGLTEKQIARRLLEIMQDLGAEDVSFPPIVASGKGSALPHHRTSNKKIRKGDPILMDFGARVSGYNSDLTRMVYVGPAPKDFKKSYNLVLNAQQAAIEFARSHPFGLSSQGRRLAKLTAGKVHDAAIKVLGNEAKFMLHGVGHGVGLEVHEKPFLRSEINKFVSGEIKDKLEEGMVVTIEPGLYYEGRYGIRIEDLGVVVQNGFQILSKAPKDLIEI